MDAPASGDVAADEAGFVLADVAALDRVWERTRPSERARAVDAALNQLRKAADVEDLPRWIARRSL